MLTALLLATNRVVSIESLVDAAWYDDPPATARTQVQICVSRLRNGLAEAGMPISIITRSPGYLLRVPPGALDAQVFETLVAEADALSKDNRPEEAAACLRRAIDLWRGPALAGTPSRVLRAKAVQLDEKRLAAVETYADLQLQLGNHHELIGEIGNTLAENPLRERLRGQLMLALYRAGRQAEALSVYRAGRDQLIEQTGLEPGTELRQLQRAILAGDRTLLDTGEESPPETDGTNGPFQLPTDIADFTGRTELVEAIRQRLTSGGRRAVRVVVLVGKPGVGKSALAVHVGHSLIDNHFPDGQLYADLGGTRAERVTPEEVLGRFLRALGIPGSALPDGVDERAEFYRDLLYRKRMLIVLDDADSAAQLRPLLPGSNSCAVIVTSRTRPTALPGAWITEVEVMGTDAALELLSRVVGPERVTAEPAAATALIRFVGGLPLALRVVAARLAARPHWTLARMRDRLVDERHRLDELTHGELIVRASLALSYDGLDPAAGRLFRLLGGVNSNGFPAWVAAALIDEDVNRAADLLELLVDAQMLEIATVDLDGNLRYKFHDVIRLFAREQLEAIESAAERLAALRRLTGGWLALATEAHRRTYGGDFTVLHGTATTWGVQRSYVNQVLAEPVAWLERERDNLCEGVMQAADEGLDELCWDLAVTLVAIFEARCYFTDWERTHLRALEVTLANGNRRGTAALRCSLGSLHLTRARTATAEDLLLPALAVFEELGDVHGRALATRNLALLDLLRGNHEQALWGYQKAAADFTAVGDRIGQAHVLSEVGHLELEAGNLDAAEEHLDEALTLCRRAGNRRVEVQVRYRLCGLQMARDRLDAAAVVLTELLEIVRADHDVVGEGRILHRLGQVNARRGRLSEAATALRGALEVCKRLLDRAGAATITKEITVLLDTLKLEASDG